MDKRVSKPAASTDAPTPNLPLSENNTDRVVRENGTRLYDLSLFNNKNHNRPQPNSWTWNGLCQLLSERDLRSKKDGLLVSGATYAPGKTRCNSNVEKITVCFLDFDDGTTLEDLGNFRARLNNGKEVGLIVYSTYSHTPEKPKLRIVLKLSRPVSAQEWNNILYPYLYQTFDGEIDDHSKDVSRMHYLPSCPPESAGNAVFKIFEGEPLDVDALHTTTLPNHRLRSKQRKTD